MGNGDILIPKFSRVKRGEETVNYRRSVTWVLVPEEIISSELYATFNDSFAGTTLLLQVGITKKSCRYTCILTFSLI